MHFNGPISYPKESYEIYVNKIQENGRVWIALASSAVYFHVYRNDFEHHVTEITV